MANKNLKLTILFLFILSGFLAVDVVTDIKEQIPFRHWFHELLLVSCCLLWIIYQLYLMKKKRKLISSVMGENDEYRKRLNSIKHEFELMVTEQLQNWQLTTSEIDIANLLIKGVTMKEIASLRGSKESTIRQQAAAIYRKSGLENRNQLAAYFLDY